MQKLKITPENEYNAVRQEIITKIGVLYQLLGLKFTIAAAFIGFGVNNNLIILSLPPIIALLAIIYNKERINILTMGRFLADKYEVEEGAISWERHMVQQRSGKVKKINSLFFMIGTPLVFLISPILAMVIGISNFTYTSLEYSLVIADVSSLIIMLIAFAFGIKHYV